MKLILLAVAMLLGTSSWSRSQALRLEGSFARSPALALTFDLVGLVNSARPSSTSGRIHTRANAVLIGDGLALTSAHCVRKKSTVLTRLRVGGIDARVLLIAADLALVSLSAATREPCAQLSIGWDPSRPTTGERLSHIYYDHGSNRVRTRAVHWNGSSAVDQSFDQGMSGSGLYSSEGRLVGIAELTTGYAEGPLEIGCMVDEMEAIGIQQVQPGGTMIRTGTPCGYFRASR